MTIVRRWAFSILSALSLALLVVVAVLWVRSGDTSDRIDLTIPPANYVVFAYCGRAYMVIYPRGYDKATVQYESRSTDVAWWELDYAEPVIAQFECGYNRAESFRLVGIPLWCLGLCTAVPPLLMFGAKRSLLRRRTRGLCLNCNYDLRAHRAGQRCPECGTTIPVQETSAA